jgi:hypothetical protein
MPKKVLPIILPHKDFVYDDDANPSPLEPKSSQLDLSHLAESFQLADLLKQLGHEDASEFVRPARLLTGLKPASLIERLKRIAEDCGGVAALVWLNSERLPEIIWSYACSNGVNQIVGLALAGAHCLGFLRFPANGEITAYPENQEQELALSILNVFARGFAANPEYLSANELLAVADPANVETLYAYSEWSDRHPINIHDEITFPNPGSTETVQEGKV